MIVLILKVFYIVKSNILYYEYIINKTKVLYMYVFSFISSRLNIIGNQVYQKQKTKNSKRKTGSYSEKLSYSQKRK